MSFPSSRFFLRLATAGALVAALGLAACGRKGPLDAPPSAAVQDQTGQQPTQRSGLAGPVATSPFGGAGSGGAYGGNITGEQAPVGPKKKLPLDVLLN
jgi:predicted small lipoprotein YifL